MAHNLVINSWNIFAHTLFLAEIEALVVQIENIRRKHPDNYKSKNAVRRLAAIIKLAFEVIPQDPTKSEYRQGHTLGNEHKHWFRAKFFQQYRLFFRYHKESRIIIFSWVNNEKSKRAYNNSSDAYQVFRKMLAKGHPPNDWDELFVEAKSEQERFAKLKEIAASLADL